MNRPSYKEVSPGAYSAVLALENHVSKSGLDRALLDLVYLRVSQVNRCAYCVDMHSKDLRAAGEKNERIDGLAVWRETPFYSARERAALAYAEAVTVLDAAHVSDAEFEAARAQFSQSEIVELTLAISTINVWNRMSIAFRSEPGKYKAAAK
jgi:AhpD family alkylhydroperoxidase